MSAFFAPDGPGMTSKRTDWNTPQAIADLVEKFFEGPVDVDPCSNPNSLIKAKNSFSVETNTDGLAPTNNWGYTFFLNPPFGRQITPWIDRALAHAYTGAKGIVLVPARVDTKWCQKLLREARAVCFLSGRLTFLGAENPAPFPTMIVLLNTLGDGDGDGFYNFYRFKGVFAPYGHVQ